MSTDKPLMHEEPLEGKAVGLDEAERLRRNGEYSKAIEVLADMLRRGEGSAWVYFRLGNTYVDAGELEYAERAYEKALSLDPSLTNALHNLAVVYRRQGRMALYVRTIRKSHRMEAGLSRVSRGPVDAEAGSRRVWRRRALILAVGLALGIALWQMLR